MSNLKFLNKGFKLTFKDENRADKLLKNISEFKVILSYKLDNSVGYISKNWIHADENRSYVGYKDYFLNEFGNLAVVFYEKYDIHVKDLTIISKNLSQLEETIKSLNLPFDISKVRGKLD